MRIVLIGAGKLATNLGVALQQAGHEVVAIYSRTMTSANALAQLLAMRSAMFCGMATDQIYCLPKDADAYIISVKDNAIANVLAEVAKGREDRLFLHTAGSIPMDVFKGYFHHYGVLYPMQTFSKERLVDFCDIPIFIEESCSETFAEEPLVPSMLRLLAESISRHVYELSSDRRKHLHLAAVFACNFANHCYTLSADILAQVGLPFDVMLPLIDETARKVHQLHPLEAQTGPAVRYDENVIRMQEALIDDADVRQIYSQMSQNIHKKAIEIYDKLRLTEDTSHRA